MKEAESLYRTVELVKGGQSYPRVIVLQEVGGVSISTPECRRVAYQVSDINKSSTCMHACTHIHTHTHTHTHTHAHTHTQSDTHTCTVHVCTFNASKVT